jgi:hypothetical protein
MGGVVGEPTAAASSERFQMLDRAMIAERAQLGLGPQETSHTPCDSQSTMVTPSTSERNLCGTEMGLCGTERGSCGTKRGPRVIERGSCDGG